MSLSVLVSAPVDEILKENPYIDKLHSLPQGLTSKNIKKMIGALIDEMNREKYDLIIEDIFRSDFIVSEKNIMKH